MFSRMRPYLPPPRWIVPVLALAYLFFFMYGFFHWMLAAGLVFAVLLFRPHREWPAWYGVFALSALLQHLTVSWLGLGPPWDRIGPDASAIWLHPLLIMLCVHTVQRFDFRPESAATLRGMALMHAGAALVGLLLMGKDLLASYGSPGWLNAVGMAPGPVGPETLPDLINFMLSHFMGGFLGVVLVLPMALWLLVPANRTGSSRIIRSALIYLYLLPMLIYISSSLLAEPDDSLTAMLKILLLAAVVVFSFLHGWRGAALSMLVVSILIAVDGHIHSSDILELQLYVAVMGAMALLFGASVDELRQNERLVQIDKDRLQEALAALAESSRRSLHSEELERKRLARELHDEMGQTLTAMQAQLSLSRANAPADTGQDGITRIELLTERLGKSLRSVVNALTPDELDQLGLYAAVAFGSPAQMCEQAGVEYATEIYGDSQLLERLDMVTNLAAYRIVQEAVNNALKYSHCERLRVRLRIGERRRTIFVLLDILDDGIGLKSLRQIDHGFYSIRDRAAALNGVLHIHNLPGVRVHVLLRQ